MKQKLSFIALYAILFGLIPLSGCKYDTEIAHPENYVKIYMPQGIDNPASHELIMSDTVQTIIYGANYGGTGSPASDITVDFTAETSLTEAFNKENNTSYLPMPEGSFELEATTAIIPKGKTSTKPLKLKISTIGALEPDVSYLLPIRVATQTDSLISHDLGVTYFAIEAKYDLIDVSMPEAGDKPVTYSFNIADSAQSVFYSAQFTAEVDVNNDIAVSFAAEPALVDSFNSVNGTEYQVLPEGSYILSKSDATITKGNTKTAPFALKIKTKDILIPFVKYLLPVQITKATGDLSPSKKIVINKEKGITYFLIETTREGIPLTIVSYGKGSGYNDIEALANSIKTYDPDLLLVRELDVNTDRSGPSDQPKKLAELLDMPYYVFANALDYQGGEYGSALFSKFPIDKSATKKYMLSSSKSEKGPLAIVKVLVNGDLPLYFAGTHINANETIRNTMQIPELMNVMEAYDGPLVLAGDFNADPANINDSYGVLAQQFTFPCHDCPANYPASSPKTHSDYVMYKQADDFTVLDYYVGQSAVGSHLPVVLKLKWYAE